MKPGVLVWIPVSKDEGEVHKVEGNQGYRCIESMRHQGQDYFTGKHEINPSI
jgi:hypothetical protein